MAWLAFAAVLAALDQWVKYLMTKALPLCEAGFCESIEILPVLKFVRLHNDGAAFSFLAGAGGWQRWFLLVVSTAVSAVICVWLLRVPREQKILTLALAFILGGAVGNLVDRALLGYVVDYVLVYYNDWYFPAFNVADSCVSIGAALLILDMFTGKREQHA